MVNTFPRIKTIQAATVDALDKACNKAIDKLSTTTGVRNVSVVPNMDIVVFSDENVNYCRAIKYTEDVEVSSANAEAGEDTDGANLTP